LFPLEGGNACSGPDLDPVFKVILRGTPCKVVKSV
jgi:hypothetical protein